MSQQEQPSSQYWEEKDRRMARMNSLTNANSLLDIAERMGLLKHIKSFPELFTEFNGIRNQLMDMVYEGLPKHESDFHEPKTSTTQPASHPIKEEKTPNVSSTSSPLPPTPPVGSMELLTEKQFKMMYRIMENNLETKNKIFEETGYIDYKELKLNLSKNEASRLIEKYKGGDF